jgi:hypothetical protein
MSVKTRVMRRSEQQTGDDRLETSEFLQQVIDSGDPGEDMCQCQDPILTTWLPLPGSRSIRVMMYCLHSAVFFLKPILPSTSRL